MTTALQAHTLTADELSKLRDQEHATDLFIAHWPQFDGNWSGYQQGNFDAHVYTLRVNGAPASNDQVYEVTYDRDGLGAGVAADWNECRPDMMVWVGSGEGKHDKGIVRLRGFDYSGGSDQTSGTMYIGETSEIEWADDLYLTVIDVFAIWPRHIYIDSDGNIYMDRGFFSLSAAADDAWSDYVWSDGAYSDEHELPNPIPVLGPDAVVWLTGDDVDVKFDASDSYALDGGALSFLWEAPGSSATSDMATDHPVVTYDSAGVYRVECTISRAYAGGTVYSRSYRRVFVFDDNNPPLSKFSFQGASGNVGDGGWEAEIVAWDECKDDELFNRSRAIIFAKDRYNQVEGSVGPIYSSDHGETLRENIVMSGWVDGESIVWDNERGNVRFRILGPHYWLSRITAFPHGIEDVTASSDWYEFENLTIDVGLWALFYWRSTLHRNTDLYLTGDSREIGAFSTPASNLWEQITKELTSALLGQACADRYGRLMIEIPYNLHDTGDRAANSVFLLDVDKSDWRQQIGIERATVHQMAMVDLSGVNYNGPGSATAIFSLAPGHVFGRYGGVERVERVACFSSQADNNALAARVLGRRQNEYPNVDYRLRGDYRVVDICPQQYVTQDIAEGDTERGIVWSGKKLIVQSVEITYDAEARVLLVNFTAEGETFATTSADGDPPITPPEPPDPSPPPPTPPPAEMWQGPVKAAIVYTTDQVGYTPDLLRHYIVSTATAGTGGTTLIDTSIDDNPGADYNDFPLEVGDAVYNPSTREWTTVASVDSGTQLTLDADISLGNGDTYQVCGALWYDVGTDLSLDTDDMYQLLYSYDGDSVGAWALTSGALYRTSNILTTSPSWSNVLSLADMRSELGNSAVFRGIAVSGKDTCIVHAHATDYDGVTFKAYGALETTNGGGTWSVIEYSITNQWGAVVNNTPNAAPWWNTVYANGLAGGTEFAIRAVSGYHPITNPGFGDVWADGTIVNPGLYTDRVYKDGLGNFVIGLWAVGNTIYVTTENERLTNPSKSTDGGVNFATVSTVGYTNYYQGNIRGHYNDADLVGAIFEKTADSDDYLLISDDGGSTWSEKGNATDEFNYTPPLFSGPIAKTPWFWEPDPDVLLWSGRAVDENGDERRLFYSDDGGDNWYLVMGNWYTVFTDWGGGTMSDFIPLPRVGANI